VSTIAENIEAMAEMVARVKKAHHLTEATVMRIVDMNFALAQSSGQPSFSGNEELLFPGDHEDIDLPPTIPFPDNESDIEAVEDNPDDPETIPTPLDN
jgi:hypothetical protein